jgi:H+/Cl- antiporter ClcA
MLEIVCYAIALTAAAWAVWVRRGTRPIPYERTTTSAIIQLTLALVLISPAAEPVIGRLFWEVFGKWHLNDMLGHIAALGALAGSTFAGMMRMPALRQRLEPLLYYPFVLGMAMLVFLFWPSAAAHSPANDIFHLNARQLPGHTWFLAYLTLLFTLLLYYAGLKLRSQAPASATTT